MRRNTVNQNQVLYALAGTLAGFLTLTQLNLQEVLRWDRFQHTTVSMILFLGFAWAFSQKKPSIVGPALAALAIGFVKECGDPSFQNFDMVANFVGVTLGILIYFASTVLFEKSFAPAAARRL